MKNNIDLIDKVLIKFLLLDGNESSLLEYDDLIKFKFIIVELSKIKYDIRYCKKKDCFCHPEYRIKELMENEKLLEFLENYCYKDISKDILELVTNYEPKIAKGIYED